MSSLICAPTGMGHDSERWWSDTFPMRRRACANCSASLQHSARFTSEPPAKKGAGGAEGIRTPYLDNANVALYQLSYSPSGAAEYHADG